MEWYGSPLTLLPPLVTIGLAIATQRVRLSLSIGLGCGALLATQLDPLAAATRTAGFLFHVALDADNILITTFSLLVASMVAVIERNGGTIALVRKAERIVRGPRSAMAASWLAGLFVFFDDYANCLMVGTTFRPLYDRHRLSHAKLAYIVDSTAAPVASFAVISTWIGYELGLLADALKGVPLAGGLLLFFVSTLPFRFYSIYSLAFVGAVALSGRDFGPMARLEHETRAATLAIEKSERPEPAQSAWLAAGPILSLLLATVAFLYLDGPSQCGSEWSGPSHAPLDYGVGQCLSVYGAGCRHGFYGLHRIVFIQPDPHAPRSATGELARYAAYSRRVGDSVSGLGIGDGARNHRHSARPDRFTDRQCEHVEPARIDVSGGSGHLLCDRKLV